MKRQVKDNLRKKENTKKWYLVDAKNKVLGRLATQVASILRGKNNVEFVPYLDKGDYVVIINASKVVATGRKEENKKYYRYSGFPGGLKTETLSDLRQRKPEEVISHAVWGMLPKNRLGRSMLKKLYIYPGEKHPHQAQKVEKLEV